MRGRLAEGGPVPGLRGLWGRFWPGPFPLTLDLDAGNGRSGRRRFPGEGLQPLGSIPAPPPTLPPVIDRCPLSASYSSPASSRYCFPKLPVLYRLVWWLAASKALYSSLTQKLEFPRRLWAEPLSRIHAKAFRPRGDLGKSTCAGLAVCAIVFLPFRRQLLQRRSRLPTWSTQRRPACVGRYSVARKPGVPG